MDEISGRSPDLLGNSRWEEKGIPRKKGQVPSRRSDRGRGGKRAFGRMCFGNVRGNLVGGQRVCT